ncbi:pyridoxamine 5'-phosphate oxidase family protein [Arenibacter sp. F20364]|uniref:pyridoxamine 5'-phosphate oxidase family protein n=1 Tax=Arenibacter sp. F20364 TaxID=2926415 RepID=UPI001FF2B149|nr:pyridoxamine 5'-phosphate oxidase family protein [Arenibacter sp. F20364]MCK0190367.1 pyridoxamine 5'-phosphate oxidase family protein [Arenibacter sp. F20364]
MTNLTTSESIRLLKNNYTGYLGYIFQDKPYVLPITYFYDKDDHSLISYSADGHKIDAMRDNNAVSLLVEDIKSFKNWQTVMAHGTYEELQGTDAKYKLHQFSEGLKALILRKENRETEFISEFSSKLYSRGIPTVYRIKILEITGKRKET